MTKTPDEEYMQRVKDEAYFRYGLPTPDGAEEWLGEILMSCGREFGDRPERLPLLLGTLQALLSVRHSEEIKALFFKGAHGAEPASLKGRRYCAFNRAPLGQNVCEPVIRGNVAEHTCRHCGRPRTSRELGI